MDINNIKKEIEIEFSCDNIDHEEDFKKKKRRRTVDRKKARKEKDKFRNGD
jgi:hypothetical protein